MRSWLFETGSLTQRLRSAFGQDIRVQVLEQHWAKPFRSEATILRLRPGAWALIREVRLLRGDVPVIAARTLLPKSTLRGAQRRLARLGTRPLGEVIFSYPKLLRLRLELARLKKNDWSAQAAEALALDGEIRGRRTLYSIDGGKFLVCEFFLPEILSFTGAP